MDRAEHFRTTMLPHLDAAYTLARYLCRDATAAEDIVQDAFLKAFRGFDGWRGEAAKAWLLAIVRNCFLTSVARDRARVVAGESGHDEPWGADEPVDDLTPELILAQRNDAILLRATIESIPEPFREVLVLRELEELSYKEIAVITDAPIGTVMSRLARGRAMLAQALHAVAEAAE
ncbi:sigma-70 family RNA polymerase sigma factor [Sphingomonas nostoxanthinifaciens]|uniref:sigma-70 family RNA polymerase sigma factor n=1 Tax=Sphingomonas nostoxanthinifaciens TaxID=2872652 RepID=UPI001CC2095F|nr:sigma-70 family RNA polymerase sigma factor [Sphingomonas nostoxanthinifaciens]UAK24007.1 sigma-70 family RNA polymerase sigma factor [Sphingomonas nostoxanthinifaciens]